MHGSSTKSDCFLDTAPNFHSFDTTAQMVTLLGHFEVEDKDKQQAVGGALEDFFQKWGDGIELGDVQVS